MRENQTQESQAAGQHVQTWSGWNEPSADPWSTQDPWSQAQPGCGTQASPAAGSAGDGSNQQQDQKNGEAARRWTSDWAAGSQGAGGWGAGDWRTADQSWPGQQWSGGGWQRGDYSDPPAFPGWAHYRGWRKAVRRWDKNTDVAVWRRAERFLKLFDWTMQS
eukprot:9501671-Pyramimonas_sp.AAC.1